MREFIEKLKDKKTRKELIKFAIVGITTTLIDFGIMALVLFLSNPASFSHNYFNAIFNVPTDPELAPTTFTVILATCTGFLVSISANYICSVFFVYFYGHIGKNKSGFLKFLLFALIGLTVNAVGPFVGYHILGINVWIVKIFFSILMFIFNYLTRKYFIFNLNLIYDEENTIRL